MLLSRDCLTEPQLSDGAATERSGCVTEPQLSDGAATV
jgi:hypothetical protein